MEVKEFRGNENWLEEYLPLKWGGLRVFLWGLVYLLGMSLSFITCSFYYNDRLSEEDPAIVALLITSTIAWMVVTFISVMPFLNGQFTAFPWAYLGKYWRNNVISPKIIFSSSMDGTIVVNPNNDEYFRIRKQQKTHKGEYGPREEFTQFTIRCGGWFWRRNTKGWCNGRYVDFSDAIKSRSCHAIYSLGYASSTATFTFGDFNEIMDFWHSNVSRNPKNSLKKYGELTTKVAELETELQKCRELISTKDMHISEFGRHILNLYLTIALALNESTRLAINREPSKLLRKLLEMGLEMRDALHHEFDHDPLKVDPQTNRYISEIHRISTEYLSILDAYTMKNAKKRESKDKPKTDNPSGENLPDPPEPPA